MPLDAKRYKIRFDPNTLTFDDQLPEGLQSLIKPEEFDAVIRKINTDLNQEAVEACKKMKRMGTVYGPLSLAVIGIFLTFNMARRARRSRKALSQFFKAVEDLLNEWNRKTFLKRRVDWRLVQDKKRIRGRDVANPFYAYRIDILHKLGRRGGAAAAGGSRAGEDSGAGVGGDEDIMLPSNVKFEGSVLDTTLGGGLDETQPTTSQSKRASTSSAKRVSFTDDLVKEVERDRKVKAAAAGAAVGAAAIGAAVVASDKDGEASKPEASKRVSFTEADQAAEGEDSDNLIVAKEDLEEDEEEDDDLMIVSSTPAQNSLPSTPSNLREDALPEEEEDDDDDDIVVKKR